MNVYVLQTAKIIPYWIAGISLGAFLSVFQGDNINRILLKISSFKHILLPVTAASVLGAASPVTLFGIIPVLCIFDIENNKNVESVLTAFITSSILISPNIFIFTISLGFNIAIIRLLFSIFAGIILGMITGFYPKDTESFLNLNKDQLEFQTESAIMNKNLRNSKKFILNFLAALKKTGINLTIGILISFLLFFFIPDSLWEFSFSDKNLAVPLSAALSVGLYQCGGGSIPILQTLIREGLPVGAAMTFMMVGPLTKMTNLAALKSIMSFKNIIAYCSILIAYMLIIGWSLGL